ncbi:AI-2E family transporter [Puia dinghuensis]|uniref:AI-2E family transporter n=1 Tax=Puia dinghuensis TaxID=1792502 RepID=A0A8J2UGD1_9BACT|nr:AI-2E family transporter [Puia dinghuensis]GGB14052.1 AI-2E family transporter [Puia dinghuensis]
MTSTRQSPFYIKLAMVLISLIALFYIAVLGKSILVPLVFGLLFSVVLLPLAHFMERKLHFPRSLASILSVVILVLSLAALLYLVGMQITNLADDWPQFKQQVTSSVNSLQQWISSKFHIRIKQQNNYINNATSKLLETGSSVIGDIVLSFSSTMLTLVFILIDTFFLLFYRRLIIRFLVAVFKEENSVIVFDILTHIQTRIRQYIMGLLIEMVIVSVATALALWILGVKYAILLGLITGLFNIIPYIGIFTATLLSTIVTFATAGATKLLLVIATILGIHLIDSNVLLPVVVGSKVRINAFITVIGVIIGNAVWGIAGTFLAIPIIAIAKIIFDRIEPLKPWGYLFGDGKEDKDLPPKDAKERAILKEELKEV